jgi:outer membrane protein assembly factor BamA
MPKTHRPTRRPVAALAWGAIFALSALVAALGRAESAPARPDSAPAPADSVGQVALPDSASAGSVSPLPVARPAGWDTLETGLPEEVRLRPIFRLRYNRVDGPAYALGVAFQTARGPAPVLFGELGHALSRKRVLYEVGLLEPIGDRPWLAIGGSLYRRTATEDGWIVGETENTIFALLARTDYRDYYETQGAHGYLAWSPGADFSLRAGARFESHRSLAKKANVSLMGHHGSFRPNPAIQEGDEEAFTIQLRVGPVEFPLRGGTRCEIGYERSGSPLDGDFEYGRVSGAVRSKIRLSPGQDFRVRVNAGSTRSGVLPAQKIWHLGGIGTLRGHDYKSFDGDQFFLLGAELCRLARKNLYALLFVDYGAAWFGDGNLGRQKPALDAGLGLRVGEGPIVLTVAKNLRDGGSKPRVGVRLGGSF